MLLHINKQCQMAPLSPSTENVADVQRSECLSEQVEGCFQLTDGLTALIVHVRPELRSAVRCAALCQNCVSGKPRLPQYNFTASGGVFVRLCISPHCYERSINS